MVTRKQRKTHDVDQTEKMIPFITSEMAFRQHVCEKGFCINVFDLDFGVQATLNVRDTCLIVGHLSVTIIFITAACLQKCESMRHSDKMLRFCSK